MKARELVPRFPGALDEPAFVVGMRWCTAAKARCNEEEACPLASVCAKQRKRWKVV